MSAGIWPQQGFQVDFLSSPADIVIGGGAAGAGKTHSLLVEPTRHIKTVQGFGGVIFRRTYPQIKNEGGLWDTSYNIYPKIGLKPNESTLEWTADNGNKIKFSHLQYEKNIFDYQGAQIPFIGFDELTHFTEKQFFYLLSRNRSVCGIKPYVRATCNPDPDSWVKRFIQWWIDEETGFPIKERCGKLRYFTRDNSNFVWGDSAQEVIDKCPHIFTGEFEGIDPTLLIKSVTFIPGSIYHNKELLKVNPSYLGDLLAQDEAIKSQLLEGNWNVKVDALSIYNYASINDLFTNEHVKAGSKYITIDAARFGSDLAVLTVWNGRRIIDVESFDISSTKLIADTCKELEKKYGIPRSNTICDADGIGGGVIDQCAGMQSFVNNGKPIEKIKGKPEQYEHLKAQCYYKSADVVNESGIFIEEQAAEKVLKTKPVPRTFRENLCQELRVIKRGKPDQDGKKTIIKKQEMKNILGRSPDCADAFMMREFFDLKPKPTAPKAWLS